VMQRVLSKKRLYKAINVAILGLVGGVVLLMALATLPGMVGLNPVVVLSGSMRPTLQVGDVAVLRSVAPASVKEGDVVTFRSSSGLITHRVVRVEETDSGRLLYMKGDANNTVDQDPIADTQVIAKMAYSIPKVGFLMVLAESTIGTIIFIGGPVAILLIMWAREWDKKRARARQESAPEPVGHGASCNCLPCWSSARGIPYVGEVGGD